MPAEPELPPGVPEETAWLGDRPQHGLSDPLQELLVLARSVRFAMAARLGISESELHAMEHVVREPMGPVELSRRLDLTSAAATVLLHRLEQSGHVSRTPHPTDRRATLVEITDAGSALQEAATKSVTAIDFGLSGLTPDEEAQLTTLLARVRRAAGDFEEREAQPRP